LPSAMFISASSAAVELRWCRRMVLITVLLPILSRLRGRCRAVRADFCAIFCNINLASTLVVAVLALILAPRSLIEVSLWSLAAGDAACFDHVLSIARGPARLKCRPEPVTPLNSVAGIQCSPRVRSISRRNATSIVRFTQLCLYRDHNPAFRSVVVQRWGA
jgi:hypothetical protein